ncbi:MAG: sialate O-acetylesterase [Saprospiraceae bacterium]
MKHNKLIAGLFFILFLASWEYACQRTTAQLGSSSETIPTDIDRTANFPKVREPVKEMPDKEQFWIFILAGQSNMAGRGLVAPSDTISNPRILSIDQNNNWVYAKEPLHFYEPTLTGLDCGLSFARTLLESVPENVTIGLLPCAVGGSSIAQWNEDEEYRGVKLFSNFREKAALGASAGVIKGILWHQGESEAHTKRIPLYREGVSTLFAHFRAVVQTDHLPIIMGEIGAYTEPAEAQARWDSINTIINTFAAETEDVFHIDTEDLTSKADHIHFNAPSQRKMGERFARKFIETQE